MSSKKDPDAPRKPRNGFSRRGFIRGVGISTGALGSGLLETAAQAAPAGNVAGPGAVPVTLKINGKPYNLTIEPRVTLIDALRNHLEHTGSKKVCDRATCGACTVIMDSKVVYGCTVLAIEAQGKEIQTIEGISENGRLLKRAFTNSKSVVSLRWMQSMQKKHGWSRKNRCLVNRHQGLVTSK